MKKIIPLLILTCSSHLLLSQDNFWNSNIKTAFGELGYGKLKLSAAGGLRFWNVGVSFGLTGFANAKPKYIYPSNTSPYTLPKEYEREEYKFTYILVTTDFYYFFDISDVLTISPSFGFFVQQDSVLVRSIRQNDYGQLYFFGKALNSIGVNIGFAIDYFYSDIITVGIGYHTRRGIFLRIGYYWF